MKIFYPNNKRFNLLLCFALLHFGLHSQIDFTKSDLDFNGFGSIPQVTSLMYGPDGRLYVVDYPGTINVLTIERNGPTDYKVIARESLSFVKDIVNYDDDGSPCSGISSDCSSRETTGLTVAGTAANPVIYVTSSDFRIGSGVGGGKGDVDLDTNSGIITRISWNGSSWDVVDLVRGLPRSEENHATNGLEFVNINGTNYLIVASGGITNGGSPSTNFVFTCEYALSAAILSIDLDAINAMPIQTDGNGRDYIYDIPTLDDPTRANENGIADPDTAGYNGIDVNDPWGGNDGLNQAMIVPGGPVQVLSPGYRNAYDLVVTENAALYVTDNGANQSWGGLPFNEGSGAVTNQYDPGEPGTNSSTTTADGEYVNNVDHLEMVTNNLATYSSGSFYAGHPNPIRANPGGAGLFTAPEQYGLNNAVFRTQIYDPDGTTPGSTTDPNLGLPANWPPVPVANPVEGDWRGPGFPNPDGPDDALITTWGTNTNGIDEYTATNFGGAMKGDLIAGHNAGLLRRVELNPDGTLEQLTSTFLSDIGGNALGVSCNSDSDVFPGTIWVGTLNRKIVVFEPADFGGGTSPVVVQNIPDLVRQINAVDEDFDLDNYFDDDNGVANLTYTVQSNTNPAIGASITGNILTISYPSTPEFTSITIRATDMDTNFVEQSFTVNVVDNSTVLYRVNTGGPPLAAIDGKLDWDEDRSANNSQYLVEAGTNSTFASTTMPVDASVDQTTTPLEIFASERFDNSAGIPDMAYSFPVTQSGNYEIRLYMGNSFAGTSQPGERIFDVEIEGTVFPDLQSIDLSATYGHQVGTVITHILNVTDGFIDIKFIHGSAENPLINAIEIINATGNIPPIAVAEATPLSGDAPLQVNFTGSNSTDDVVVVSYLWDFKDGSPTSSEADPVHTFTEANTYQVELTVEDAEGATDTDTVTIVVSAPPNEAPVAVVSATPTSGKAPLEVNFTGSNSTDDVAVVSYLWDFKDGSPNSSIADPVHTFTSSGTYLVELTVEDAEGLTDTATITILVEDITNEAPVAVASATPTIGTAPLEVTFNGSNSIDDIAVVSYLWNFDDGSPSSSEENPVHSFTMPGTYQVELTVEDAEGLSDTDTVIIVVNETANEAPIAVASATPTSGSIPLEVSFTGSNSTDDKAVVEYLWDFDDGSPNSNEANPVHTYNESNTYQVVLTVEDAEGLSDTAVLNIIVTEVDGTTGSTSNDIEGNLTINPATNFARVQIIDKGPGDRMVTRITLHDLNGRLVGLYSPKEIFAHGLFEIPIYQLSDGGIYIIGFEMNTGDRVTLKLIVKN